MSWIITIPEPRTTAKVDSYARHNVVCSEVYTKQKGSKDRSLRTTKTVFAHVLNEQFTFTLYFLSLRRQWMNSNVDLLKPNASSFTINFTMVNKQSKAFERFIMTAPATPPFLNDVLQVSIKLRTACSFGAFLAKIIRL